MILITYASSVQYLMVVSGDHNITNPPTHLLVRFSFTFDVSRRARPTPHDYPVPKALREAIADEDHLEKLEVGTSEV